MSFNIKNESLKTPYTIKPALNVFFKIMADWNLNTEQSMTLLGIDSKSTYFKWKRDPESSRLDKDKIDRLSYVFGIYKALQILLPNHESADSWIKKENSASPFNGKSALDRMLSGHIIDLHAVREYLDSQRGWS
ncbi:MAG: MbcA/ParS/Xre antitoxin family protein [Methylococcaceae bacterium]